MRSTRASKLFIFFPAPPRAPLARFASRLLPPSPEQSICTPGQPLVDA